MRRTPTPPACKSRRRRLPQALGPGGINMKKAKATAQQFEGFFVGQMMEHMMAGVEADPIFGGGHGEDMWRSMLNQEYGKEIAKSGKLGIANNVMKAMLQAQEQRTAAAQSAAAGIAAPAAAAQATAAAQAVTAADPTANPTSLTLNTPAGILASARILPVKR